MDNLKFKVTLINKEDNLLRLEMFINGKNILEWKSGEKLYTTQWDLDEIIEFLTIDTIEFANSEDDFPYDIKADNLLELKRISYNKEFDNEDEELEFLTNIHDYFYNHSIMHARSGGIIADLIFRHIGNYMEISWDNENLYKKEEKSIIFTYQKGAAYIDISKYKNAIWDLKKQFDKIMK